MSLTKRLSKGVAKRSSFITTFNQSEFGTIDYYLPLGCITMNLLTSGKWDGGVACGKLTMFAGAKGSTKTLNMYEAMKSMQSMFEDSTIIYVDSEHAAEQEKFVEYGIDPERILYMPLSRIDDENPELSLMYQMSNIFAEIEKNDKVMVCVDSIGVLTTGRSNANALKGNTAKDMSITSEKKRFVTLLLETCGIKKIPGVLINHIYSSVGSGFGDPNVVAGGSVLYLPSQTVMITSKAKMKPDADGCFTDSKEKTVGNIFTAIVEKGRLAKERTVAKFAIHYKHGFLKYYGLAEYALEGGFIEEGKDGRSTVYSITGNDEIKVPKKTMYMPDNYKFWETLFSTTDFGQYLNKNFEYGS